MERHRRLTLFEPETNVFTFAAITLGVFDDKVDLTHLLDKDYR